MSGILKSDELTETRIISLRLAVGALGERDNAGWWQSGFMSTTSSAFLMPVFGSNSSQARYEGVVEAARRVHDERIGVGHAFHPFRLPENMEQRLFDLVQTKGRDLVDETFSADQARATLERLAEKPVTARSGPALVGAAAMLDEQSWIAAVASLYLAAFSTGVQCFPYFTGTR
ncbi:BrxE family protein [Mesorhizobium sp. B2-4-8]|uniref:BrxE family protein n=1 Tax=Mesorhizobium sp. B2-4-8 TaxID=2589941 RepID=UPI001129A86A|nr:BrxE family protein [Mesorhizobium sp. B2-4-8]TPL29529.1 BrxE family protein [Mesorhizobium sp. B2-4-8]